MYHGLAELHISRCTSRDWEGRESQRRKMEKDIWSSRKCQMLDWVSRQPLWRPGAAISDQQRAGIGACKGVERLPLLPMD